MINGPASILNEPVPDGVLSPSATLHPPPEPIGVQELMESSIPDAWKDGRTNALAIITALSAQRGRSLPWSTVQSAIDSGIRARWIELTSDSNPWPCEFAGARHVVIQAPETQKASDGQGTLRSDTAGNHHGEATLEADGIQDLAEQIPAITMAAVGTSLKFNIQIELGGGQRTRSGCHRGYQLPPVHGV